MIRWFLFFFCKEMSRKDSLNATQYYVQKILNNCLIELLKELVRNLTLLSSVFLSSKCQSILLFFWSFFQLLFSSYVFIPISNTNILLSIRAEDTVPHLFQEKNPVLLLNTFTIPFVSFLFFFFNLFLAALGLRCCMRAFSNCSK